MRWEAVFFVLSLKLDYILVFSHVVSLGSLIARRGAMALGNGHTSGLELIGKVLGLSLYAAWVMIMFSGEAFLPASSDLQNAAIAIFPLSTLGFSAALLLFAAKAGLFNRLLHSRVAWWACAALGILSTFAACAPALATSPLSAIGAFFAGSTSAIPAIRGAEIVSEYDSKTGIVLLSVAQIIGILAFSFSVATSVLVGPLAALTFLCVLVPASALLLQATASESEPVLDDYSRQLPDGFWRIVVGLGAFSFACCFIRGVLPSGLTEAEFGVARWETAALGLVLLTVVAFLVSRSRRDAPLGAACYYALVGLAGVLAVLSLVGIESTLVGIVTTAIVTLTVLATWIILLRLSYKTGSYAVRVFGFGFGATVAGFNLGFVTGTALSGFGVAALPMRVIGVILAVGCALTLILLFRRTDIEALMQPFADDAELFDPAAQLKQGDFSPDPESVESSGGAGAPGPTSAEAAAVTPGAELFHAHCVAIADRYGLSPRETEVFALMARGGDAKAIAEDLIISYATARTHIRNIYRKMDVHSRHDFFRIVNASSGID